MNMRSFEIFDEQLKEIHKDDCIISDRLYNIVIGIITLYGLVMNFLILEYLTPYLIGLNFIVVIVAYCLFAFIGITIVFGSQNPLLSFLGYNLVVIPVGSVFALCFSNASSSVVNQVFLLTAVITGIMLLFALIFPDKFNNIHWRFGLAIALASLLIAEFFCIIFFNTIPNAFSWIGAAIYSLYIGYEWAMAQFHVKTLDNAIDSATNIYLSIVGLMLKLRRIFENNN